MIGAGAHGFPSKQNYRYANLASFQDYLDSFSTERKDSIAWFDNLSDEDSLGEILSLGLRTSSGIKLETLRSYSGFNESSFMLKVESLVKENFIILHGDILQLTAKGQEVADSVILALNQVSCISL